MAGLGGLGFLAGGAAQGFQEQSRETSLENYRLKELQIQQQGQQNAIKRFEMTRNDEIYNNNLKTLAEFVEQAKIAGHNDPKEIIAPLQGFIDTTRKFGTAIGRNDFDGQLATILAAPPKTQTAAAMAAASTKPEAKTVTGESGDQSIAIVNPGQGTVSFPGGGPDTTVPAPRADLPAGQVDTTFRDQLAKRAGLTAEELDVNGRALAAGNVSVLQNLGRGRQGGAAVKATRAWAAHTLMHEEGLSPQTAAEVLNANVAEFKGELSGAQALGRREAIVIGASTTAMQTAPRVLEASKAVSRTEYPSLNSIILAAKQGTGDPNVVRYGIAVNTFVNNYARAIGAGSAAVTNSARAEAFDNLQKAWSNGQIEAAVDQMLNKELPSEVAGAKMGMRTFLRNKGFAVPADKADTSEKGSGKKSIPAPPAGFVIQQ